MSRSRKGCAFCDTSREDWDYKVLPINLGMFGDYNVNVWVQGRLKKLNLEFEPEKTEPTWSDSIDIEYCPFCGTKLDKLAEGDAR